MAYTREVDTTAIDHLLRTTRTVRKRLDITRPVPLDVIAECLEIALQAPTAGHSEGWHFVVVTEPALRAGIADIYRRARAAYHRRPPSFLARVYAARPDDPRRARMRVSGDHLAAHLQDVPVHVLACIEGRAEDEGIFAQASLYGSILPAAWSLMLALRARGLGAAWTTDHLLLEREVAALVGLPADVTQAVLLAVAYYTGTGFKPASRKPLATVTHWNGWGLARRA
jgi:nitroreductase